MGAEVLSGYRRVMRDHYDFSNGVRGKYAGKVNTADIRLLRSAKPDDRARGGIRQKRGDTLVGTLPKT